MGKNILVIGSINVDYVIHTERVPAFGETLAGDDFSVNFGGKGANALLDEVEKFINRGEKNEKNNIYVNCSFYDLIHISFLFNPLRCGLDHWKSFK